MSSNMVKKREPTVGEVVVALVQLVQLLNREGPKIVRALHEVVEHYRPMVEEFTDALARLMPPSRNVVLFKDTMVVEIGGRTIYVHAPEPDAGELRLAREAADAVAFQFEVAEDDARCLALVRGV